MRVCILCACDSEEREHGVGAGVNSTILSETLKVVGLAESVRRSFWLRRKPMNLCVCDSEECDHWVGAGVNSTILSGWVSV